MFTIYQLVSRISSINSRKTIPAPLKIGWPLLVAFPVGQKKGFGWIFWTEKTRDLWLKKKPWNRCCLDSGEIMVFFWWNSWEDFCWGGFGELQLGVLYNGIQWQTKIHTQNDDPQKYLGEIWWVCFFGMGLHPGRLTWKPKMEVWKIIFLSKWVICRFQPLIFQAVVTSWFYGSPCQIARSSPSPKLQQCRAVKYGLGASYKCFNRLKESSLSRGRINPSGIY